MIYMTKPPGSRLPGHVPAGIPVLVPGRLLGVDAGGSATRAVVVADGQVVEQRTAPPMNALLTMAHPDRLLELIRQARVVAAGIGLPGLRSAERAAALAGELTMRAGCPVHVTNDGETAWLGAFGGEPGIVVMAGTGSAAFGCDGERWARAGGHGFLLGDEGSAYWIGRAAVQAALRWEDGMDGGSQALHRAVTGASGQDLAALVRDVHSRPADRDRLAGLAPVVTALASQDQTARRIAQLAGRNLAALAGVVRRRLGPLPVAGLGGVLTAPVIWDAFAELTGAARPLAPPEVGAALLAGARGVRPARGMLTGADAGDEDG
jgi:N-acetylglucosamine kinase-like BadF-type ATPase